MQRGEEEIVELVNAVIDGEATPDQQAELQRLITTSPEARELFESTGEIARRLEAMPRRELPRDWYRSAASRTAAFRRTKAAAPPPHSYTRSWFAIGWAAAAALVLFVVMIGRPHLTDTGATMAPVERSISFSRGTLLIRRNGDLYTIEPVISGPRPMTILVGWDDRKLDFVGVSDEKDASFGKASVKFTLRDPSQRAGVIVRPRRGTSAAEVRVSAGEEEIMRAVVPFE